MCAYRIQVVDNVLKEPGVSDQVLYNRARGLLLLGAIFKSTIPDESDEERRDLERCVFLCSFCALVGWRVAYRAVPVKQTHRMVAEAAKPKKKQAPPSAAIQAAQNRAHEARHGHGNGHTTAGDSSPPHPAPSYAAPASSHP